MRLINIHSLEFERFTGADIPRYAIASHRWGNNEAAYKDVLKKRNTDSAGYKKVQAFCDFVKKWDDTIGWLWIDTCCIDKKSSAEESEAINSMYAYYSRAEVCVAYLADVWPMAEGPDAVGEEEVMQELQDSVWFSRGWTLQELLAPATVVFTTSAWEVIGYKTQVSKDGSTENKGPKYGKLLNDVVASITGIPEYILWDFQQSKNLGVPERMAWMSRRHTTRIEDMAYCLLGIFGVHMALIYGEGEGAMLRLEEEVRKKNASAAGSVWGDDTRSVIAPSQAPVRRFTESNWGDDTRSVTPSAAEESRRPTAYDRNDDDQTVLPPLPERPSGQTTPQPSQQLPSPSTFPTVAQQQPLDWTAAPPPRAMTTNNAKSLKELKAEYKLTKHRIKAGKADSGDSSVVSDNRSQVQPPQPSSAPPMPPIPRAPPPGGALNDRVNAWRESTNDITPSVADDDRYQDDADAESVAPYSVVGSETLTNLSSATAARRFPGQENNGFRPGGMRDMSDALPPPPPYPGSPPRSRSNPSLDAPQMGIQRAQTFAQPYGSNGAAPPTNPYQNRLLQRITDNSARSQVGRNGILDNDEPNAGSSWTHYTDEPDSLSPSDSASQIGGPSEPTGRSRSFLQRIADDQQRRRGEASGSPVESESSSSQAQAQQAPPSFLSRSQTFADTLSAVGSEVTSRHGRRKLIRTLLNDEREALKQARKALRRQI